MEKLITVEDWKMFKRLINHIKRWNKWRKYCRNGWLYKISVLFGNPSPTFPLILTDEEEEEMRKKIQEKFEEVCQLIRGNDD